MQKNRVGRAPFPVQSGHARIDGETPRVGGLFTIAGIGASAGGLPAIPTHLGPPLDTGPSFVPVQHLDCEHDSAFAPPLGRATLLLADEVTSTSRAEESARFSRAEVGRELWMFGLKREVNALRRQQGKPAPYPLKSEQNVEDTNA